MTTGEILTYNQMILSSHHLLLVLFKMSIYLFFVSTKIKCWIGLPPIRAESVLMVLTKGWPGSTGSGWSVKREKEKVETKIRETVYRRMTTMFKNHQLMQRLFKYSGFHL